MSLDWTTITEFDVFRSVEIDRVELYLIGGDTFIKNYEISSRVFKMHELFYKLKIIIFDYLEPMVNHC